MKKNRTKLFLLSLLMSGSLFGQTQFWSDDFEDTGSPSSGVRTPSNNIGLGDPSTFYFKRTTNSQIDVSFGSYTGQNGTSFWAGENHGGLFGSGNEEQNIVFSSIDISGKTGLTFKGLFAANNQGAAFENMALGASHSDYMIVEYNIDGGAYQPLFSFFANNNTASGVNNKSLAEDTNGDGIGNGTILTANFTTFTKSIAGTGTALILRVRCSSNGNNEEMAFDNFQLLADACVPPVVTANPPNRFICSGGNTTFGISATDATAYQWQVDSGSGFSNVSNGGVYSGATTATLTITGATAAMAGYLYRCVAINGTPTCSANSNAATLSISNIVTSGSKNDATCNGVANGAAAVSAAGGANPYSYSWSPSGGTGSVATGLAAGSYTVTVTDNIGCTATRSYTIDQPTVLTATANSQTNVSCNNGTDGAASVAVSGGTTNYSYDWTGTPTGEGTASVTGLSAGAISCTVTDANGCTATVDFTITEPTALTATADAQTNVSCNNGTDGAASVSVSGGTTDYTYDWTGTPTGDGTASVTGLAAGVISCTVTDANGCTATVDFTINEPTALTATADAQTNVSCNNGTDGAASVSVSGGTTNYSYDWTGTPTGDGTASVTDLAAGAISCTVTDANGCTATVDFTITEPTTLTATTDAQTNVSCNNGTDGAASVAVSGGTTDYTYDWTGTPTGDGTASVTDLAAGAISCTVTDANGCTATVDFTITEPAALTATIEGSVEACQNSTSPMVTFTGASGTAPYTFTYTVNNGANQTAVSTGNIATVSAPTGMVGTFEYDLVSIEDASSTGCLNSQTGSVTITVNPLPTATISGTIDICQNEDSPVITFTGSNSLAPYTFTYTVNNGANQTVVSTGNTATVNVPTGTAGTFVYDLVSVQDASSTTCSQAQYGSVTGTVHSLPSATITSTDGVTLVVSEEATSYQWINCSTDEIIDGATSATYAAIENGEYAVQITNENNCINESDCFSVTTVGFAENTLAETLVSLFPNPTKESLTIELTEINETSVLVYNTQGKLVLSEGQVQSGHIINISSFEPGVYFVKGTHDQETWMKRIVKM